MHFVDLQISSDPAIVDGFALMSAEDFAHSSKLFVRFTPCILEVSRTQRLYPPRGVQKSIGEVKKKMC